MQSVPRDHRHRAGVAADEADRGVAGRLQPARAAGGLAAVAKRRRGRRDVGERREGAPARTRHHEVAARARGTLRAHAAGVVPSVIAGLAHARLEQVGAARGRCCVRGAGGTLGDALGGGVEADRARRAALHGSERRVRAQRARNALHRDAIHCETGLAYGLVRRLEARARLAGSVRHEPHEHRRACGGDRRRQHRPCDRGQPRRSDRVTCKSR